MTIARFSTSAPRRQLESPMSSKSKTSSRAKILASSAAASATGRANRRRDTRPELALRSALHRSGLRFRVDFPLWAGQVRVRPDIVFRRQRVVVFVDGCFWHGCADHYVAPRVNDSFWAGKLVSNRARDRLVNHSLEEERWMVVRIWEHIQISQAFETVVDALVSSGGLDALHPR